MTDEYNENIRRGAFALGAVALSLQDFATQILTMALRGEIDPENVAEVRRRCVNNLKNSHFEGLSTDEETLVLTSAIRDLENHLDAIVDNAVAGDW